MCLVSLGGVIFVNQGALAHQLQVWQVVPRPEGLSELYFTDHTQLPARLEPGSDQTVKFTVNNHEQRVTEYRYKLLAIPESDKTQYSLGEGWLILNSGEQRTASHSVTIPSISGRVAVKVTLEYIEQKNGLTSPQTQSIHYWMNVVGGSKR